MKWIEDGSAIRCSECGYAPISKIFFRGEKIWEISLTDEYHYCPKCGSPSDEISNIAKESADRIAEALEKVKAKGWQKQNIEEDDKE